MANFSAKAHIVYFGCRLNQYESDALAGGLEENHLEIVDTPEDAQYIIINTCTVTNSADYKNRAAIRRVHDQNPAAKIIVTGCYATTDKEQLRQTPGVFWVVDNLNKAKIPQKIAAEILAEPTAENSMANNLSTADNIDGQFGYQYRSKKGHSRAHLKVQDGCNKTCSYCKIPLARGKGVSRPKQSCVDELTHLIKLGFQEIVITGVNLGWYKDQNGENFNDLLRELLNSDGDFYLRLSSIEPADVNAGLIENLKHPKMAKFLHVPLQSGSKNILKKMRRGYTPRHYQQWISAAREAIPDIHIGTDIIIGFPGETDEDFMETIDFAKNMRFDNIHIFPFSKRNGTIVVNDLQNGATREVHGNVIKSRCQQMKILAEQMQIENLKRLKPAKWRTILIQKSPESWHLLTENYINLKVDPNLLPPEINCGEQLTAVFGTAASLIELQYHDKSYKISQ